MRRLNESDDGMWGIKFTSDTNPNSPAADIAVVSNSTFRSRWSVQIIHPDENFEIDNYMLYIEDLRTGYIIETELRATNISSARNLVASAIRNIILDDIRAPINIKNLINRMGIGRYVEFKKVGGK